MEMLASCSKLLNSCVYTSALTLSNTELLPSDVYQTPGLTEITALPRDGSGALAVGSGPLSVTVGHAHSWGLELGQRTCFRELAHNEQVTGTSFPELCDVQTVLQFLQSLLDAGRAASTLRVYLAAISVCHDDGPEGPMGGHPLLSKFMKLDICVSKSLHGAKLGP